MHLSGFSLKHFQPAAFPRLQAISVHAFMCTSICGEARSKAPTANPNGHGEFTHRWPCRISVFADEYISSRSADITGDKQAIFPTLHYTASHFNMYLRACVCVCVRACDYFRAYAGTVRDFLTKFNLQDDIRLYKHIYFFTHKSTYAHAHIPMYTAHSDFKCSFQKWICIFDN